LLAVIKDLALLRLIKAVDAVEQRCLAGAIRSDNSQYLVIPNINAYLVEGCNAAKTEPEVVNL